MEINKDFTIYYKDGAIVVEFALVPLEWITHGRIDPQPLPRPIGEIYSREYNYEGR